MKNNDNLTRKVLSILFKMYCRKKHNSASDLCGTCSELLEYSLQRQKSCPKLPGKPICYKCKISCFAKEKKILIKEVMRFGRLRFIFIHPILMIKFVIAKIL